MAKCTVKITCEKCGNTWKIPWRKIAGENSNRCPVCDNEIDRTIWDNSVILAAGAALDANMEIEKDCTGYQRPGFSVNFINKPF